MHAFLAIYRNSQGDIERRWILCHSVDEALGHIVRAMRHLPESLTITHIKADQELETV